MRVTAGKFRGRKLIDRPMEHLRPTADLVKQAVFNKLAFSISGGRVLDLFCGTGAIGIEAISRGAREVVFVDASPKSIKLTKDNLAVLNNPSEAKVICGDYKEVLKNLKGGFDIIFLDPPYKSGIYEDCVREIFSLALLKNDGIIVCEHNKEDSFDFSPFEVVDGKIYGIKKITYLKNLE